MVEENEVDQFMYMFFYIEIKNKNKSTTRNICNVHLNFFSCLLCGVKLLCSSSCLQHLKCFTLSVP